MKSRALFCYAKNSRKGGETAGKSTRAKKPQVSEHQDEAVGGESFVRASEQCDDVKYDWGKIEQEYISGKMSMEKLAEKYHIPNSTFRKYANVHNFKEKRTKYGQKVAERAIARAQARDARTLGNLQSALDKASRLLNRYITDEDTLFGRVSVTADGMQEYRARKMDTKAMRDMTAAMREVSAAIKLLQPETAGGGAEEGGVVMMPEQEAVE